MNKFVIKKIYATILSSTGFLNYDIRKLNQSLKNNYIRIINYHDVKLKNKTHFEKQLIWLNRHFKPVDLSILSQFINGNIAFADKPGILLTFDDGLSGNFFNGAKLLEKHGFRGIFFVSTGMIGNSGFMTSEQLNELSRKGHTIGCHTYSHHRMSCNDSEDTLQHEICNAKKDLEKLINDKVDCFCWCGGEEETYTANAALKIYESGFEYSFMTNASPVLTQSNQLQLERSNVEDDWSIALLKYQISSLNDQRFLEKKNRVEKLTAIGENK